MSYDTYGHTLGHVCRTCGIEFTEKNINDMMAKAIGDEYECKYCYCKEDLINLNTDHPITDKPYSKESRFKDFRRAYKRGGER